MQYLIPPRIPASTNTHRHPQHRSGHLSPSMRPAQAVSHGLPRLQTVKQGAHGSRAHEELDCVQPFDCNQLHVCFRPPHTHCIVHFSCCLLIVSQFSGFFTVCSWTSIVCGSLVHMPFRSPGLSSQRIDRISSVWCIVWIDPLLSSTPAHYGARIL